MNGEQRPEQYFEHAGNVLYLHILSIFEGMFSFDAANLNLSMDKIFHVQVLKLYVYGVSSLKLAAKAINGKVFKQFHLRYTNTKLLL